ncbi:uncharacterized protein LOC144445700 [Glandiceps talaboti]
MTLKVVFACFFVFTVVLIGFGASYPLHASCKLHWTFGTQCQEINTKLMDQMKKWEGPDNCKQGGEKCLYKVLSSNSTYITATHTTPVKMYVDTQTYSFKQSGQLCIVQAYSSSNTWYAVLDYSTNYCNLHNLVVGAKLDKIDHYTETTSDSICTQYSSANCTVY